MSTERCGLNLELHKDCSLPNSECSDPKDCKTCFFHIVEETYFTNLGRYLSQAALWEVAALTLILPYITFLHLVIKYVIPIFER